MPEPSVRLEEIVPVPVAVIRRQVSRADLPRVIPDLCGQVWAVLRRQHIRGGRNVAIYHDSSILLEVGVECADPFRGEAEVQRGFVPGGRTVVTTHVGTYATLSRSHDAVRTWARYHGLTLAGPGWERYGHWQSDWDEHPDRIQTDIGYLVG